VTRTILCILLAASACADSRSAGAATCTRGPYLQLLTTHSVTIVWRTDQAAACAVALVPATGVPTTVSGSTGTLCAVAADGLAPGGVYAYTPLADGTPVAPEATFRTDDPQRPFTFLVVGDSGSGSAEQRSVRDRMLASQADFVLSTGDMVYESGAAEDFDAAFFVPYQDLLRRVVFWPVLGNHDVKTRSGQPWRDAFYTPANNPAHSKDYYSFDFGNAHVVVLDSNADTAPGSAQHTFLDHDLAASRARWRFVAFHHAIYSVGRKHGSDLTVRRNLVPLFDRHHVDVVFNGHNHVYERSKPLRNDVVVGPGEGTTYVTTGGGGKDLQRLDPPATFTAYAEASFHFTRVVVKGDALRVEMVRADGSIPDVLELSKSAAPPDSPTPASGP
jgi:predicted phosphodiesterase